MVSITSRISLGYRSCYQCYDKENKCRPLFSRFLGFCQNILNVTEKQTRKTCFLHLALHIYHANFSFDGNKYGGGIILYVREEIPAKVLCHDFPFTERFLAKLISTKGNAF